MTNLYLMCSGEGLLFIPVRLSSVLENTVYNVGSRFRLWWPVSAASFGLCQLSYGSYRAETEPLQKQCVLFITSLNKTHTQNHPLEPSEIGKMGNVIAVQLVSGLMCLLSQFSQAQWGRMWCQGVEGQHIRTCWYTAGGRNTWQDEKETLQHVMVLSDSTARSSTSVLPSLSSIISSSSSSRLFDEKLTFVLHLLKETGDRLLKYFTRNSKLTRWPNISFTVKTR